MKNRNAFPLAAFLLGTVMFASDAYAVPLPDNTSCNSSQNTPGGGICFAITNTSNDYIAAAIKGVSKGGDNSSGLFGENLGSGDGVHGVANGTGFGAIGVHGLNVSTNGTGVQGTAPQGTGIRATGQTGISASGSDLAITAEGYSNGIKAHSTVGYGVYGSSEATWNSAPGVWGYGSSNTLGVGVKGQAVQGGTGVWGFNPNGQAAWFDGATTVAGEFSVNGEVALQGNVWVGGTLAKAAGSFLIDHPLDPANKVLRHSFVESPDMKNIYDGVVTLDRKGEGWITLPSYFSALNRDFRYQLTNIGAPAQTYVAEEIRNNRFKIAGGRPGMKVSWQVTGTRQDDYAQHHRIAVEEVKAPADRGRFYYSRNPGAPSIGSRPKTGPEKRRDVRGASRGSRLPLSRPPAVRPMK